MAPHTNKPSLLGKGEWSVIHSSKARLREVDDFLPVCGVAENPSLKAPRQGLGRSLDEQGADLENQCHEPQCTTAQRR